MTEFLLFTIYAPLVSWGDIAVGELRGSWDRPSRSAVLGLVAAAQGLTRDDQSAHDALDVSLGIAVRLDAAGSLMVDYHTAQTVAASALKKRSPKTRAQMLAAVSAGDRQTILSRRTYRQDALATIAAWRKDGTEPKLGDLADALRQPRFVLYAGRKTNVLGLPLAPAVVESPTLAGAFAARDAVPPVLEGQLLRPRAGWGREVSHDPCDGFDHGLESHRREIRRDAKPHRTRWQFSERVVEVGLLPHAMEAANGSVAVDSQ